MKPEGVAAGEFVETGGQELLFEVVSSIAIEIDAEARVVRWNQAAANTFGIESSDAHGLRLDDLGLQLEGGGLREALTHRSWLRAPLRLDEVAYRSRSGRSGLLGLTFHPIRAVGDRSLGAIVLGKDITEQKLESRRKQQAQRMATIGELAAALAHEVNTPTQFLASNLSFLADAAQEIGQLDVRLRAILAEKNLAPGDRVQHLQEALSDTALPELCEDMRRAVDECREGNEQVAALIRGLKELFAAPDAYPADVARVVRSVLEATRSRWAGVVTLESDVSPQLPALPCREADLREALLPLVLDACDALDLRRRERSQGPLALFVEACVEGDMLAVRIGHAPEDVGVVEEFRESTDAAALAIARTVVENALQGELERGTRADGAPAFVVRIPLVRDERVMP